MADKDTSTDSADLKDQDEVVENDEDTSTEDENLDDDDQDDEEDDTESDNGDADDSADEDESDDDSEDDSEDEDDQPEFKKAFSQIKGETPEEYLPNLEEAYRKSSREAKRLFQSDKDKQERLDKIDAAVAKNPELAKAIKEATEGNEVPPNVDPALLKVRQEYNEKVAKDLDSFVDSHPDLDDEDTMNEFMENLADVGTAARKKGKLLDPMVAYKKAWAMMDHDDSKETLANAAKSTASKPKTSSKKTPKQRPTAKPKLSADQIAYGKKMGLTEKQLLDNLAKED